ncbi:MAG: restriction endonuclease subunit S [Algoriphagus sp.]|uniref:restriction endonuclease subunit S n=1 Tax=Algoriphagus sp. TaxID=1872435 RepID=UPI0026270EDC|nr:restriction endonuclease subunit S [Algoriphagus sp.]MDG1277001.1 restriction endonuclease subunit S [Algoriphagus sp.]
MMGKKRNVPKLRFPGFSAAFNTKRLEEICDKIGDGLHGTPKYDENGDYPFINGNNLSQGILQITDTTKRVGDNEYKKHKKHLGERSLLLSINGTIGNLAYYRGEQILLGKSAAYISFSEDFSLPFGFYLLQTSSIRNFFSSELTGSTIKNLSLKTIRETKAEIPSLPEQQKIATFLTAVDRRIELLEQKKEKLEAYKKGVMQQIFSRQIRFKQDDGSEFPDWEEKKLGEVGDIVVGGTPSTTQKEYWGGNIGWIGSGELKDDYVSFPTKHITHSGLKNSSTIMMPKGTVLLAMTGATLGKTGLLTFECCGNQSVAGILPSKRFDSYFMFQVLQNEKNQIFSFAGGAAQIGINKKNIEGLTINLPSPQEQEKIAVFLSKIDLVQRQLTMKITQTQIWKKGLLQQMFV